MSSEVMYVAISLGGGGRQEETERERSWNMAFYLRLYLSIDICPDFIRFRGMEELVGGTVWVVFTAGPAFGVRFVFSVYL